MQMVKQRISFWIGPKERHFFILKLGNIDKNDTDKGKHSTSISKAQVFELDKIHWRRLFVSHEEHMFMISNTMAFKGTWSFELVV